MIKVTSFEEACKILNIEPVLPAVDMLPIANQKAIIANYKLDVIQQASIGDWKPDWNNWDQNKYYPWFKQSSSGSGFSYCDFGFVGTLTTVGSRRVFPNVETAKHVGQHFIDLYNDAMSL